MDEHVKEYSEFVFFVLKHYERVLTPEQTVAAITLIHLIEENRTLNELITAKDGDFTNLINWLKLFYAQRTK